MTTPASGASPSRPPMSSHWRYDTVTWWVWTVTAVFLVAGLFGVSGAREIALGVTVAQTVWLLARHRNPAHFPTQIRLAYLALMVATFLPALTFLYWVQTVGTLALILVGYCPMARFLMLFPWNRPVPLTLGRALRIVFHPPTEGSILEQIRL